MSEPDAQEQPIPRLTAAHAPHLEMLGELLDCDECIAWLYAQAAQLEGEIIEAG